MYSLVHKGEIIREARDGIKILRFRSMRKVRELYLGSSKISDLMEMERFV